MSKVCCYYVFIDSCCWQCFNFFKQTLSHKDDSIKLGVWRHIWWAVGWKADIAYSVRLKHRTTYGRNAKLFKQDFPRREYVFAWMRLLSMVFSIVNFLVFVKVRVSINSYVFARRYSDIDLFTVVDAKPLQSSMTFNDFRSLIRLVFLLSNTFSDMCSFASVDSIIFNFPS